MKEEFLSGNYRDFRQRYRHCYGFFTPENSNKNLLVYLTEVDETQATFIDCKKTEYIALPDKGNLFEFIPIQKKLFYTKDDVMLAQRVPARQWSRGVSSANTQLVYLRNGRPVSLSFAMIEAAFLKEAPKSRLKAFLDQKVDGMILNDAIAIVGKGVYVYNVPIGDYDPNKYQITVYNSIFRQELIDAITDTPIKLT